MLERLLPRGSNARRAAIGVGLIAASLLYTQVFLVGDNQPARGTPMAILFQGLLIGLCNALTAAGIILVYRATRIINFAQSAIGLVAFVFIEYMVAYNPGFPFVLTLIIGLVGAGLTGALFDLIFGRRFARSSRLIFTVVTIEGAVFIALIASSFIPGLGIFPPAKDRVDAIDLAPERIHRLLPFAGFKFHVGSLKAVFGFPEILAVELVVIALVGLAIFLRYTKSGVAIRAAAENAERAALLGIGVPALGTMVWVIAGVLSGMNLIGDGLMNDPTGLSRGLSALLAPLAAAVLARMKNLPTAIGLSIIIGIVASATAWTYSDSTPAVSVALLVVIVAGLLLQRRGLLRTQQTEEESSWETTAEPRPIPKELRDLPTLRWARVSFIGACLLLVGLLPFMFAVRIQNLLGVILIFTIVGLSLVVLTGWAGQISLGQFGFVAVGAAVAGGLNANWHWSFWLSILGGTIVTAAVAALIGLPALRIRGLYLAVVTFGFAAAVSELFSSPKYLRDHLPRTLDRPTLFFINFADERSMYYLALAALLIVVVVVVNLRRSRFGRLLIAARENETNVQSFGVALVQLKVMAFVVSGAIAGFAGSLYAFQQRGVNGTGYAIERSANVFVFTVIGGISSAGGALIGSAYGNLSAYFLGNNRTFQFFIGILPLIILYIEPGGVITLLNAVRDSWLRIVAQRRQLVVPSLFADYDADALSRRLIPLGAPITGQGLAALPSGQRFSIRSTLRGGNGDAKRELPAASVRQREAAAIGAAGTESDT